MLTRKGDSIHLLVLIEAEDALRGSSALSEGTADEYYTTCSGDRFTDAQLCSSHWARST